MPQFCGASNFGNYFTVNMNKATPSKWSIFHALNVGLYARCLPNSRAPFQQKFKKKLFSI